MKRILTLFIFLAGWGYSTLYAQVQVPNGGFETWVNNNTPTSWSSISVLGLNNCYQSTDFHNGTYAARLVTVDTTMFTQHIMLPGLITLGTIDILNQLVYGGIPCTDRPDEFQGYFKFFPIGGDTLTAGAYFWVYDSINGKDTVGMGTFSIHDTVASYTPFSAVIEWDSTFSGVPDSMNIIITNCGMSFHGHTVAFYDDLTLYYGTIGLSEPLDNLPENAYPNPTHGVLNVPTKVGTAILLYNITGDLILSKKAESDKVQIDLSGFPKGFYFLKQTGDQGSFTHKIVLN